MRIEITKGMGYYPEIEMNITLNCDDILRLHDILKKINKDKALSDNDKAFFIPITKTFVK